MATDALNVLGVRVSLIDIQGAIDQIDQWIVRRQQQYVCVCTVHTIMECRRSPALRQVVNRAGMNTPDGMPLVWLGRLERGPRVDRVYGPDLMIAEMAHSISTGGRHYLYGGQPGVVDRLSARLRQRFPGVQIVGTYTPPVDEVSKLCTEEAALEIDRCRPDIVWIGLSTPKQELWMGQMRSRLAAPVLIGVGAAFNFHSGTVPQAPRLIQRSGLEWVFRLVHEPGRLWRRYLFDNPRFVGEVILQRSGVRRFDLS
jgi:N-acetylglucosaminyldiphosphoundecaprenol N-acetyl-beta-D-mannosaminyltransferase